MGVRSITSTFGITLTILTESELCHPDKNPIPLPNKTQLPGLGRHKNTNKLPRSLETASGSPRLGSNGTNIVFYLYFLYAPVFVTLEKFRFGLLRIIFLAIFNFNFCMSTCRPSVVNSTFSVDIKFLIILKEFLNEISFGGKSSLFN